MISWLFGLDDAGGPAVGHDPPTSANDSMQSAELRLYKQHDTLDLAYLRSQIIVMGLPWLRRTERNAHRNNVRDLGTYLEATHPDAFMVFNLTPFERGAQYNHAMLNRQVCK